MGSLELGRAQLGQEGPDVQRMAAGVGMEPLGLVGRQVGPGGSRQEGNLSHVERKQGDKTAPLGIGPEALPTEVYPGRG